MTDNKKENGQETRIRIASIVTKGDVISRIVQTVSKYTSYSLVAYFGYKAIDSVAANLNGKVTIADIKFEAIINWLSNSDTACVLAIIVGVAGILYGTAQAKLRKDIIERFHPYQEKYEKLIDENRSSSNLTQRGETRPEDE